MFFGAAVSEDGYMDKTPPNRIAAIRKAKKLSQHKLGEMVGAHWITISKLERGKMQLTSQWMDRLSAALDVDAAEFLSDHSLEREVTLAGCISEGGSVDLYEDQQVARISLSERYDMVSDWLEVNSHDMEPYFFKNDMIQVMYIHDNDVPKLVGRMGYISTSDGRELFGVLHKHIGNMVFDVRTLRFEMLRAVEVADFGLLSGCYMALAGENKK